MSLAERVEALASVDGTTVGLRAAAAVAPLGVVASAWAASGRTTVALAMVAVGLALWAAVAPDSVAGVGVVLVLGVLWLVDVDDPTTPWALTAGVSVAVFHAALAAASTTAALARWPAALVRRWAARAGVLAVAVVVTWVAVVVVEAVDVGSASVLVAVALALLAAGAAWAAGAGRAQVRSRGPR